MCYLLLLVGYYDDVIVRFEQADVMGWGCAKHLGVLVLFFLLFVVIGEECFIEGISIVVLWFELDVFEWVYFDCCLLLD